MNSTDKVYDASRDDHAKALAAIHASRRKTSTDSAWEWATIACNHAISLGVKDARTLIGTAAWPDVDALENAVMEARKAEVVIVTRHPGLVEWLAQRGYVGRVIERATPTDILGKHVIGVLPTHLVAIAASYTKVCIPSIPEALWGAEMSAQDLDDSGAFIRTYTGMRETTALQP